MRGVARPARDRQAFRGAKVSQGSGAPGVLSGPMPRWFFLLVVIALGLSLGGGVLIFLRSPTPVAQRTD